MCARLPEASAAGAVRWYNPFAPHPHPLRLTCMGLSTDLPQNPRQKRCLGPQRAKRVTQLTDRKGAARRRQKRGSWTTDWKGASASRQI
eukprot:364963-Chlamydomonas_euryale.AAC.13